MSEARGRMLNKFIHVLILIVVFSYSYVTEAQQADFSVKMMPFASSINDEFAPVYFKNGLVYCSNALSNTTVKSEEGRLFNILLVQRRDSLNWKNPDLFSKELTTILNEGPATFTSDGNKMFFARNNIIEGKFKEINTPSNTMGIFSAELIDGVWSNIKSFPFNSPDYSLGTPALSNDNTYLYFASDMPGGYGGTDIYYSELIDGKWQKPVNLGPRINTAGNESYPFVNAAEQLFFASDGLPGFGGKDIYFSAKTNGRWQDPLHLGANINSTSDDFGLITDVNFSEGFFSSDRRHSVDIYQFKSELPQFGYCDTIHTKPQCFEFFDERFTDTLHLEYEWNFGNGERLHGYRIEKCFSTPGDYEVVLTITHNLADSVFKTKHLHRFTVRDVNKVDILHNGYQIQNIPTEYSAQLSGFEGFKIKDVFWNFGEGFLETGQTYKKAFEEAGKKYITLGLMGDKDSYGRDKKICLTKETFIASDIQDLVTREGLFLDSSVELDLEGKEKNKVESYRFRFALLTSDLSALQKEGLEDKLNIFAEESITFENQFDDSGNQLVTKISQVLNRYPDQVIIIAVHSDNRGNEKVNLEATQTLAKAISNVFVSEGKAPELIYTEGYGSSRPIVEGKEKYTRDINRRIEFIIVENAIEEGEK